MAGYRPPLFSRDPKRRRRAVGRAKRQGTYRPPLFSRDKPARRRAVARARRQGGAQPHGPPVPRQHRRRLEREVRQQNRRLRKLGGGALFPTAGFSERQRKDYEAGKPVDVGGGKVQVKSAGGKPTTLTRGAYRKAIRESTRSIRGRRKLHRDIPSLADDKLKPATRAEDFKVAGLDLEGTVEAANRSLFPAANPGLRVLKAPYNLGRAFVEEPGQVTKASVKSAVEGVAGIPQGIKMLAEDPDKALKQMAKDYERRYGSLLEGDSATFRKRVKEDYGVTPYALDAAAFSGGAGQAAGAASRSGAVGRLATALERSRPPLAQKVGKGARRVHETTTRQRPNLRIAGGEAGVKAQRTSRNLFVAPVQHGRDKRRAKRYVKDAERAGIRVTRGGHLARIEGRELGRLPSVRPGQGEVLPYRSVREAPVLRRLMGRTERAHGARKGYERLRLLSHSSRVEKEARKQIGRLDNKERDALLYTMEFGLTPKNRGKAVEALETYRAKVTENRKGENPEDVLPFDPDELPVIEKILADPDSHITPRVREVANELRELEKREAAKDPELTSERAADRRIMPQAILTDTRRAPDVEGFRGQLQDLESRIAKAYPDAPPAGLLERFGRIAEAEPPERLGLIRGIERDLRKERGKAERAVPVAERQAARVTAVRREREGRGAPLDTDAVREARAELSVAKRERKRAGRGVSRQEYATGKTHGRAEALGSQQVKRWEKQIGSLRSQATKAIEKGDTDQARAKLEQVADLEAKISQGAAGPQLDSAARAGEESLLRGSGAQRAEARVREARRKLDAELDRAPRVSEAWARKERLADEDVVRKRAERENARLEHDLAAMVRKEIKANPGRYENSAAFQARVEEAVTKAGLEAGAYFESTGGSELRRSLKAIGTGVRGAAGSKAYSGERLRMGRQSGDPEVVINGLLRNAKRRFSWRYTVTTVNQAAFEWSRGPHGGGLTAQQLTREMDRRHIDPEDIEFVNVRILENRELDAEGLARGQVGDPAENASPEGGIHPDDLEGVLQGLKQASVRSDVLLREAADVTPSMVRGQAQNRYVAMAARDMAELSASMTPDGAIGRAIEIVWKQKPARILLGLANTSWLGFQIMANGVLSGLSGAVNPFDYVAAQRWWKTLTPEQRLAIEPELGITRNHHAVGQDQTHMGAATNARFVNAYRAFKQTQVMRTLHKGNPLDLMFRADEAQNNFWRKAVFYNKAKRDAYNRMGANWKSVAGAQKKMMSVMSMKRPEDRMQAIIDEAATFEKHAEHVREWMGDYLTFTTRERQTISRAAMFYGYMRFSVRMVFWTMPVHHPVMAALLTDIGRMGSQEIKRLLGVPDVDAASGDTEADGFRSSKVPVTMLAQAYFGTPEQIDKGQKGTINFGRMNPFMNAVTQMENAEQIFGLFSPIAQAEMDQIMQHSTFLQRDWRKEGTSTPSEATRPKDYFGNFFSQLDWDIPGVNAGSPRGRILQRQLLGLAQPYKWLEESGTFGKKLPLIGRIDPMLGSHSEDSLPWRQYPMRYRDKEAKEGTEAARERERKQGEVRPAIRRLMPLLGLIDRVGTAPTAAPVVLKREREKRKAVRKRGSKKTSKRKSLLGPGRSSGGSLLDGPSTSGGSLLD